MASRTFQVHIQTARDVWVNWCRNNPVLLDGEMVIVYDVQGNEDDVRLKIGDGNTPFNSLPWFTDNSKIDKSLKGIAGGVATLDENGKIPIEQLPEGFSGGPVDLIISNVPEQLGAVQYTGESQMPVFRYYDPSMLFMSGTIEAVDAGTYTVTFQPLEGYCWEDHTRDLRSVEWTILPQYVNVPVVTSSHVYNGAAQTPTLEGVDPSIMALSGTVSAVNAGQHELTCLIGSNYAWSDTLQSGSRVIPWEISQAQGMLSIDKSELELEIKRMIKGTLSLSATSVTLYV